MHNIYKNGNNLVVIKNGLCWPAFFFTVFWALVHEMKNLVIITISLLVVVHIFLSENNADTISLYFLIAIVYGVIGNLLKKKKYESLGYSHDATVSGYFFESDALNHYDANKNYWQYM